MKWYFYFNNVILKELLALKDISKLYIINRRALEYPSRSLKNCSKTRKLAEEGSGCVEE